MVLHFNSTMVRLKGVLPALVLSRRMHFNSTMVRLKDIYATRALSFSVISIPLWYD